MTRPLTSSSHIPAVFISYQIHFFFGFSLFLFPPTLIFITIFLLIPIPVSSCHVHTILNYFLSFYILWKPRYVTSYVLVPSYHIPLVNSIIYLISNTLICSILLFTTLNSSPYYNKLGLTTHL